MNAEKAELEIIKRENKILSFVLPIAGAILLLFGLLGFILVLSNMEAILELIIEVKDEAGNIVETLPRYQEAQVYGIAVVLIIFAFLGAGGIAYGVYKFIRFQRNKFKKEEVEPVQTLEKE